MFKFYYLVSDLSPETAQLATRAYDWLLHSFQPSTQRSYSRMFQDFMGFLVASGLSLGQVNIHVLLAFLEYLHSNAFTVANISSYLDGIRAFFILHALPTDMFKDQRIQMFVKSLQVNIPLLLKTTAVFSIEMLRDIVIQSQKFEFSQVFIPLYLLAFYSFLRLSNIAPHAFTGFDTSRHVARGDLIFGNSSAVLILKWSKTNQLRNKVHYVTISLIPQSLLCPVLALKNMLAANPGSQNDPLFTIPRHGRWLPLTDSIVRKHLKRVIKALSILLGGQGPLGRIIITSPFRPSKTKELGLLTVCTDTFLLIPNSPLLRAFQQHIQSRWVFG